MELKVLCECGQKFKFDVEPVNGQMPFTVNCPVCNADTTSTANTLIAERMSAASPATITETSPPPPPIALAPAGLRINRHTPEPATAPPSAPVVTATFSPPPISGMKPAPVPKVKSEEFNLVRGIVGALLGAAVGCGALFGFWLGTHIRFPLMGTVTGVAAGYTARWLARGTDTTLGIITAVIAGASVTGTFVLMYGEFAFFNILSIIICAGFAYRITSD